MKSAGKKRPKSKIQHPVIRPHHGYGPRLNLTSTPSLFDVTWTGV